jgi:hypothetical protein
MTFCINIVVNINGLPSCHAIFVKPEEKIITIKKLMLLSLIPELKGSDIVLMYNSIPLLEELSISYYNITFESTIFVSKTREQYTEIPKISKHRMLEVDVIKRGRLFTYGDNLHIKHIDNILNIVEGSSPALFNRIYRGFR